jgi:hypothetical protein
MAHIIQAPQLRRHCLRLLHNLAIAEKVSNIHQETSIKSEQLLLELSKAMREEGCYSYFKVLRPYLRFATDYYCGKELYTIKNSEPHFNLELAIHSSIEIKHKRAWLLQKCKPDSLKQSMFMRRDPSLNGLLYACEYILIHILNILASLHKKPDNEYLVLSFSLSKLVRRILERNPKQCVVWVPKQQYYTYRGRPFYKVRLSKAFKRLESYNPLYVSFMTSLLDKLSALMSVDKSFLNYLDKGNVSTYAASTEWLSSDALRSHVFIDAIRTKKVALRHGPLVNYDNHRKVRSILSEIERYDLDEITNIISDEKLIDILDNRLTEHAVKADSVLIVGTLEDEDFPLYLGSVPQLRLFKYHQKSSILLCKIISSMSIDVTYRPHPSLPSSWRDAFERENITISSENLPLIQQAKGFSLTIIDNYNTTFWECLENQIPAKLLVRTSSYPMSRIGNSIMSKLMEKGLATTDLDLIQSLYYRRDSIPLTLIPGNQKFTIS